MKGGGKKRTDLNEKNFLKKQRRANTRKLSLIQGFQDNQLLCFSVTSYRLTEIFMLLVYKTKLNPPRNSRNRGPFRTAEQLPTFSNKHGYLECADKPSNNPRRIEIVDRSERNRRNEWDSLQALTRVTQTAYPTCPISRLCRYLSDTVFVPGHLTVTLTEGWG